MDVHTAGSSIPNPNFRDSRQNKGPGKKSQGGSKQGGSAKLRGLEKDSPEVRLAKTLSWLLRHGAKGEGLPMREDGYVKVTDLLANPKLTSQALDLAGLQEIVRKDSKKRYDLVFGPEENMWWIRANQGHSIKTVKLDLKPILSLSDIPSSVAVHGTSKKAWEAISKEGLSKMKRNHIHIAQGVPGDDGVISGMRKSSQIFIFIDVQKALAAGINFHFSENGVILTEGDEGGILSTEFFLKVEDAKRVSLPGWEGVQVQTA